MATHHSLKRRLVRCSSSHWRRTIRAVNPSAAKRGGLQDCVCLIREAKLELELELLPMTSDQIHSDGVVYLPDSTERAPMSIVWTTLPGISFLFPVIGHVGIGDSSGVTYDFSGPYQVTVGSLMGGPAKRQWILDQSKITKTDGKTAIDAFDDAVKHAACVYGKKFHNLFLDNCHHHVALVLNRIKYDGRSDWNQVRVFKSLWLKGEWVSNKERLVVFGPFVMLLLVIVLLSIIIPVTTR